MNCKIGWDREFLDSFLPRTFLLGDYKKHRELVFEQREMALLPETQRHVPAYKECMRLYKAIAEAGTKKSELNKRIYRAYREVRASRQAMHTLKARGASIALVRECKDQIKIERKKIRELNQETTNLNLEINWMIRRQGRLRASGYDPAILEEGGGPPAPPEKKSSETNFIRACPAEGCRGYLTNNKWTCGTCETKVCKKCLEIETDDHVCDEAAVATATLLKKDSKPCPSCASLIYKVDGCFGEDTPVLMWNGTTKMSQDIVRGDVLIGDDGLPRTVLDTCTGEDELYHVDQTRGMSYVVNSKHKLVFKYEREGIRKIADRWIVYWFDREKMVFRDKHFKFEGDEQTAYGNASSFFSGLNLNDPITMTVDDYLSIPLKQRGNSYFRAIKADFIHWDSKPVKLDPYVLGAWLGDGTSNGSGMAITDLIPHKRGTAATCDYRSTPFAVTPIGPGKYYGWKLDGNKRFLLGDTTIGHNCDQARRVCWLCIKDNVTGSN
jgi:hypothetical protein